MVCIACVARLEWPLCNGCHGALYEGPQFVLPGGILVTAAYHHRTVARRLVHRLKYGGLAVAGELLASAMMTRLPSGATVLVPVPRAVTRRVRYGIDPAAVLAAELASRTGLPVVHALQPAFWWPRHATRAGGNRRPARFSATRTIPPGAVLVDDVVTSGATVLAASRALRNVPYTLAATSPGIDHPEPSGLPSSGEAQRRRDPWT